MIKKPISKRSLVFSATRFIPAILLTITGLATVTCPLPKPLECSLPCKPTVPRVLSLNISPLTWF